MTEQKSVKDEELSVEEVFELLDNRCTTDSSGDGRPTVHGESIAIADVGKCLRVLGLAPTEEKINKLTEPFQGARISVEQFTPIYQELGKSENAPKSVEELINELFKFDDPNWYNTTSDFKLDVSYLRLLLTTMGEKMSEAEVDELLDAPGLVDGDGNIDARKFFHHITQTKSS